jgi:hypothetical protein
MRSGGLHIPNSPFTVVVTDFVSILLESTNPTLLYSPTPLYWPEAKGPPSEPLNGINCKEKGVEQR